MKKQKIVFDGYEVTDLKDHRKELIEASSKGQAILIYKKMFKKTSYGDFKVKKVVYRESKNNKIPFNKNFLDGFFYSESE